MFDLLLQNGTIIDGTGRRRFRADVAVADGCIAAIAPAIDAGLSRRVIDAAGCIVSPGFIDIHSHTDFTFLAEPGADSKVRQGITTEVVGNCGFTAAPVRSGHFDELMQYLVNTVAVSEEEKRRWRWPSQAAFIEETARGKSTVNVVSLVGHGTIRVAVLGFARRKPEPSELKKMGNLLEEELRQGLWGLSAGLQYDPGSFAGNDEMIYLGRLVARYGGIYTVHMKSEGRNLLHCLAEAIEVGKRSGVPVQISHLKASHPPNWGKAQEALRLIVRAREAGVEIDFDVYPYTAYGSGLIDLVPPWVREQGSGKMTEILSDRSNHPRILAEMARGQEHWENPMAGAAWETVRIAAVKSEKNKIYEGMDLARLGEAMGCPPAQAVLNLLQAEGGAVKIVCFAMCEPDLELIMKHPRAIFCTDGRAVSPGGPLGRSKIHPRYYGTYPRILGRYVREKQIFSLEEAIKKMTSRPAAKLGLSRRGLIRKGYYADLAVFDPWEIMDKATFDQPHRYPDGLKYVIVNGVAAVTPDGYTGAKAGKILSKGTGLKEL